MREFEFVLDEAFTSGLRPYKVPRNTQFFEVLQGARVGKAGLEPIEALESAYVHTPPETYPDVSQDWPFPQYFRGMNRQLIGLRHTLYELLADGSLLTVVADVDGVTSDDLWSFGDFGLYLVVMKDRTFILERAGDTGIWSNSASSATIPNSKVIHNFKGQAIAGDLGFASWGEVGEGYVAWSKIGDVDFTMDRLGVAGYKHVEFQGAVLGIKRLGNGVVVYCEEGIGYLEAATSPMVTFGYTKLADFGISNKGAIAGTDFSHVFVSPKGLLYRLSWDKGPSLQVLGYEHLLASNSTIIVSFLPGSTSEGEGEYYISDGVYSYLLTSYGLSQAHQLISSCARVAGVAKGFFQASPDTDFECVTNVLDFNFRARKTISSIEVGCSGGGTYEVAVDYRNTPNEAFSTTQYVPLNNQGITSLVCGGTEFRLRLAYDTPSDIDISYMKVRYKADDLRGIRGVYSRS